MGPYHRHGKVGHEEGAHPAGALPCCQEVHHLRRDPQHLVVEAQCSDVFFQSTSKRKTKGSLCITMPSIKGGLLSKEDQKKRKVITL